MKNRMIRDLRIKIVLAIMLAVGIMLGLIFGGLYHFTAAAMEESGYEMLSAIAARPYTQQRFDVRSEDIRLPYFVVEYDKLTGMGTTYGTYYDLSDTEAINVALQMAQSSDEDRGLISRYDLRYVKLDMPTRYVIAFADVSSQLEAMARIRTLSLLTGGIAMLAFFGAAVIFSRIAVRPVARAWEEQKQFIGDASHELKTPLTVITTNAELLQSKEHTWEEKERYAGNILTVSGQMRILVEDLLNLARADSGIEKDSFERVDMSSLVQDALLPFEPVFFEAGLELREEIEEGITVKGVPMKLQQIVSVLLDNALKYSKDSEVAVSLKKSGKGCLFTVTNGSEPLTKKELRDIFSRFYRTDESRSAKGSFGLGLPIAKMLAESHGGKMWAEYASGKISFFVKLPAA